MGATPYDPFGTSESTADAVQQRLDEAHNTEPAGFYQLRVRYPTDGRD